MRLLSGSVTRNRHGFIILIFVIFCVLSSWNGFAIGEDVDDVDVAQSAEENADGPNLTDPSDEIVKEEAVPDDETATETDAATEEETTESVEEETDPVAVEDDKVVTEKSADDTAEETSDLTPEQEAALAAEAAAAEKEKVETEAESAAKAAEEAAEAAAARDREIMARMQAEEAMMFLNSQWEMAMSLPSGSQERIDILMKLHLLVPDNLGVLVNLGLELADSDTGIDILEKCFDSSVVSTTLPDHDADMAWRIANFIGRYRHHQKNHEKAMRFFKLALNLSKDRFPHEGDVCSALQLATALDSYPASVEVADESLNEMIKYAEDFLVRKNNTIDDAIVSDLLPKAARDPYDHCLLTLFFLSFYYRADVAYVAELHYKVTTTAWPDFVEVAPHVEKYEAKLKEKDDSDKPCTNRKLRLGIVAGVLTESHPVTEDFSGVLSQLNRKKFDVTYIYLPETGQPPAQFVAKHREDNLLVVSKDDRFDFRNSTWIRRYTPFLAELEFDMILYLDMTMSTHARRLGMQRLAPVQLNTHGHPITSGHPRSTVQYFVSWAEAELGLEEAQTHYTEELLLVPNGTIHQYYTPRILPDGRSRLDGMPFKELTRADFGLPEDVKLYVNMQKPFKLHPEYDELICGILKKDEENHMVLHHQEQGHEIFVGRLLLAGCDLTRIHFMPMQPHHRLLALYGFSSVVLDSYPAGGCTTTREVLELGKAVVTLPAKLLGGRWTLGLYNIIGLDEDAKKAVIASTPEEFIDLAVTLVKDDTLRNKVEESISDAVPNLFGRMESVQAWEKILLDVSPYRICMDEAKAEEAEEEAVEKPAVPDAVEDEVAEEVPEDDVVEAPTTPEISEESVSDTNIPLEESETENPEASAEEGEAAKPDAAVGSEEEEEEEEL